MTHLCSNLGDDVVEEGGLEDGRVEELLLGVAQALLKRHKCIVGGRKHSRNQVGVVQHICTMHTADEQSKARIECTSRARDRQEL